MARKTREQKQKKKRVPRKKPSQSVDMYSGYGKSKEPTMGDLSKMAMDGAVLSGSLGLMTGMAGMMSTAFKK